MPMGASPLQPRFGARRCSLCNINYPNNERFSECPVCGEETKSFSNVAMHKDWLELAIDKVHHWDGHVPDFPPDPPDNG